VIVAAIVAVISFLYAAVTGRIRTIPEATQEKMKLALRQWRKIISQVLHNSMGLAGVLILVFFIAMAAFGTVFAPEKVDFNHPGPYGQLQKPSSVHWLGTDFFGHDIFSELLYGARTSMIVGVISAVIASVLGALVGLYSGYAGGWKDEVIMRANDVVLSIPWLVLMIVVAAMLQEITLTGIILIIGLTGWSTTARMVRAQVLSLKERQFVERAKAIGASDMAIIRRHIMPNAFPLVFANTILTVAVSILSEATLSFLGLRPVGTVTWGTMLSNAGDQDAFHIGLQGWIIVPGLCIVAVVLGFTLLGYALDDIMNPKLRKR
jgi:peptide/nickel transport system permease protein